jgi:hypothetical protein
MFKAMSASSGANPDSGSDSTPGSPAFFREISPRKLRAHQAAASRLAGYFAHADSF